MPTSVHIPTDLLKAADRRAKALRISRNRLIINALERELTSGSDWSTGFFDELRSVDEEVVDAVDEMLIAVKRARTSKSPSQL